MTRNVLGAAILYAVIIGLSFLFVKQSLTVATPLESLAHRFTIAGIVALGIYGWIPKRTRIITKKHVVLLFLLSFQYPLLFFSFQVFGLRYASSLEAGILQSLVPVMVVLLSMVVLKEYASSIQWMGILLCVGGVLVIVSQNFSGSQSSSLLGVLYLSLSTVAIAFYQVLVRKLRSVFHPFELVVVSMVTGLVVFNGLAIIERLSTGTTHPYFQAFQSPQFLWSILFLGVLASIATAFLSNYVLHHLTAIQTSVFGNVSTIVSIAAGAFVLGETFTLAHFLGTLLILFSILLVNQSTTKLQTKETLS